MTAKNIKQLPTRSKKVKKGDNVIVIAGKDKGKTGEILKVMPKDAKVVVSGVNLRKKHQKPSMNSSGGIVEKESPLDISNIAIVDPKTGKPTKVGFKVLENGAKVRFAKLSGTLLDQDK